MMWNALLRQVLLIARRIVPGGALALSAAAAFAQQAAQAPPAGGAPAFTRPLWTEAFITVLMIALALFVVCRNSHRN